MWFCSLGILPIFVHSEALKSFIHMHLVVLLMIIAVRRSSAAVEPRFLSGFQVLCSEDHAA